MLLYIDKGIFGQDRAVSVSCRVAFRSVYERTPIGDGAENAEIRRWRRVSPCQFRVAKIICACAIGYFG